MQVGIRAQTQELYGKIIEAYFDGIDGGPPLSIMELVEKFGRSQSSITKAISIYKAAYEAEHGQPRGRKGKPRDPRSMEDKKSFSFRHMYIGLVITRYMNANSLSPTAFGILINRSRVDVRNMQVGSYDLKLTEVERIGEVVGVSFDQLINPPKQEKHVAIAA